MKHPMETGKRKDKKTGDNIPAHFIQEISEKQMVAKSLLFTGVLQSRKIPITFAYNGSKG